MKVKNHKLSVSSLIISKRFQAIMDNYGPFLWRNIRGEQLLGGKIRINHLTSNIHLFLSRTEQNYLFENVLTCTNVWNFTSDHKKYMLCFIQLALTLCFWFYFIFAIAPRILKGLCRDSNNQPSSDGLGRESKLIPNTGVAPVQPLFLCQC